MAEESQDKTEQPTPFKLEEARKKGQVARSSEVAPMAVLLVFLLALTATSGGVAHEISMSMRTFLSASSSVSPDRAWPLFMHESVTLIAKLTPIILGILIAGVLAGMLQHRPVFSTEPLKPDFNRLNPAKGLKRIFAIRTLFELLKVLLKVGLGAVVFYKIFIDLPVWIDRLAGVPPRGEPVAAAHLIFYVLFLLAGLFLITTVIDVLYSRREFTRQMKMSKREVKDEQKRREGDAEIKAKRRKTHAQLYKRVATLRNVKDSDVVVTNPTHIAVALRYRPGEGGVPKIMAMGSGALAARMRQLAERYRIPVYQQKELARALLRRAKIGGYVPEAYLLPTAAVYRWLYAGRGRAQQ